MLVVGVVCPIPVGPGRYRKVVLTSYSLLLVDSGIIYVRGLSASADDVVWVLFVEASLSFEFAISLD